MLISPISVSVRCASTWRSRSAPISPTSSRSRAMGIVRRGRITTSWSDKRQVLRITYRNRDFCREVIVRTGEGDGEPAVNTNGRLSFDVALKAGQAWHRCLIYDPADGGTRLLARRSA